MNRFSVGGNNLEHHSARRHLTVADSESDIRHNLKAFFFFKWSHKYSWFNFIFTFVLKQIKNLGSATLTCLAPSNIAESSLFNKTAILQMPLTYIEMTIPIVKKFTLSILFWHNLKWFYY